MRILPLLISFVATAGPCLRSSSSFLIHPTIQGPVDVRVAAWRSLQSKSLRIKTSRNSSRRNDARSQDGFHLDETENSYLATCIPGLALVLAEELRDLGCNNVHPTSRVNSAVTFTATTAVALSALLWTRTAHKILELLSSTVGGDSLVRDRDALYSFIRNRVAIQSLLGDGKGGLLSISVQVLLNNAKQIPKDINHSHFSALTVKNALCDTVRELRGDRPSVDLEDPDCPLVVTVLGVASEEGEPGAHVSLYRQLHAAGSLHKRGYRKFASMHKAAMKESMAAGLLLQAKWHERCRKATYSKPAILLDPMAGSGSFLLEAAMIAADLAPGLMRIKCDVPGSQTPPVLRWKHNDKNGEEPVATIWRALLMEATQRARNGLQTLRPTDTIAAKGGYDQRIYMLANELIPGNIDIMESSLQVAGLSHVVQINQGDCLDWIPDVNGQDTGTIDKNAPWTICTNPPWGIRLTDDMHESWEALRVFVRERCPPSSEVFVLSGNPASTKHLGLRRSQMVQLKTGQHDLRWLQYVLRDADGNDPPQKIVPQKSNVTREASKNGVFEHRASQKPPKRDRSTSNRNTPSRKPSGSSSRQTVKSSKDLAANGGHSDKRPWEMGKADQKEENEWLI